jgi:hypothetical protein
MKNTYEMIWRNKFITTNASSIDDMIKSYMQCLEELQEIKKDGIQGDFDNAGDNAGDDYIFFRTEDAKLAKKYNMNEAEDEDE